MVRPSRFKGAGLSTRRYLGRRPSLVIPDYSAVERILRRAAFHMDARPSLTGPTQQTLPNIADAGATVATVGSTASSETTDPVRLHHAGADYMVCHGGDSNCAVQPTLTSNLAVGTWIVRCRLPTPGGSGAGLMNQYQTSGNQRSWSLSLVNTGRLRFYTSTDGTTNTFADTTADATPLVGLDLYWRFVVGAASVAISYSADGASWTAFDAIAYPGPLYAGTAPLVLGSRYILNATANYGAREVWGGRIYSVARDGVSLFNAADTTGWTIDRASSGLTTAIVRSSALQADGSDDFITLPSGLVAPTKTSELTVLQVVNLPFPAGSRSLFDTRAAAGNGLWLRKVNPTGYLQAVLGDGSGTASALVSTNVADNAWHVAAARISAGQIDAYLDGVKGTGSSTAALGTVTSSAAARLHAGAYAVVDPLAGRTAAFALWPEGLTDDEIGAVSDWLLAGR